MAFNLFFRYTIDWERNNTVSKDTYKKSEHENAQSWADVKILIDNLNDWLAINHII